MRRFVRAAVLVALATTPFVSACSGAQPPPPPAHDTPKQPVATPPAAPVIPMLPASVVGEIDDENGVQLYVRRGDAGLVLYTSHGHVYSRLIGPDNKPIGAAPEDLGGVPPEMQFATLKPTADGYLIAWVEADGQNRAIKLGSLDESGKPKSAPVLVTQLADGPTWLDILPNAKGALLLWETRRDSIEITIAPISGGKPGPANVVARDPIGWEATATERGAALAMVTPKSAQPAPNPKGGKNAKPAQPEAPVMQLARLGTVTLTEIDATGAASTPVVVSDQATAQVDVDVVEVGGKYVLAWTDDRDIDACVWTASVEPGGKVATPPHRATSPFGEQALVSLAAEPYSPIGKSGRPKRALLAYEDLLRAPRQGRQIHLAAIDGTGALSAEHASLSFWTSGPPFFAADGDEFVALTVAPDLNAPPPATAEESAARAQQPQIWPWFVRFGADLHVVASEPVRAEPFAPTNGFPNLTRWLTCGTGGCTALASAAPEKVPAMPGAPPEQQAAPRAPLALVSLPTRESPWKAPAAKDVEEAPPRATAVSALFDGDNVARVAATELPNNAGTLTAWVTYFLEQPVAEPPPKAQPEPPPVKLKPKGGGNPGKKGDAKPPKSKQKQGDPAKDTYATLAVRSIAADGSLAKTQVISHKAVSLGGVALAVGPSDKKVETALAWVAKEKNEPQVFVTKIGADGAKLAQKGVTVISRKKAQTIPNEASDVAIAYAGGTAGNDGWVVAWVDTRDGNAEVYAAKVDRSLTKIVPDQRITDAAGDASDVQIAVRGKEAILVWSDARGAEAEGHGDIYVARIDLATMKKIGSETRIFASAAHSRSPSLAPTEKGFVVAWIEEGEAKGNVKGDATIRIAELDAKGALVGQPVLVRAEGSATSVAMTCSARSCRGAMTAAWTETLRLGVFNFSSGAAGPEAKVIASLTGGVTEDVSPAFASPAGANLFFADDTQGGAGRVRWMKIAW